MNQFVDKYKDDIYSYEEIEPIGPHWIIELGNKYGISIISEQYKKKYKNDDKDTYEAALMKLSNYGEYEMCNIENIVPKEYCFGDNLIHGLEEADVIDLIEQLKEIIKEKEAENDSNTSTK